MSTTTSTPPLTEEAAFNVNWEVRVKITEAGHAIMRELSKQQYPPVFPKTDADGWSTWQLWHLMETFGRHLYMGGRVPFQTEIVLLPDPYTVRQARKTV